MLIGLKLVVSAALVAWAVISSLHWNARVQMYEPKPGARLGLKVLLLVLACCVIWGGVVQVNEGERGVVLRNGAATGVVRPPGLALVMPFVDSIESMSVMTEAAKVEASGASKDLQVVHAEITVNYAMLPERAVEVYTSLRHDAVARVIRPAIEEAVKAGTAEFKAEDLIQHREAVKSRIETILRQRLDAKGFTLDAVSITDFDFSDTFNRSIEDKVTATQQALKAENDLVRVRAEAQQSVARAEAEAQALKAQREAVTPELIQLRRTEALLKAIEKWDGRMPTFVGEGAPVPMLDVFKAEIGAR
jgi:regulator of protease activity HflC (stomatin/prohibitin superfamily)